MLGSGFGLGFKALVVVRSGETFIVLAVQPRLHSLCTKNCSRGAGRRFRPKAPTLLAVRGVNLMNTPSYPKLVPREP